MVHYFAYGSNMSLARLRQRTPTARRLGLCFLLRHELRFHKVGRDGSGKCDAWFTGDPGHRIAGALYVLEYADKCRLDEAEGLGRGYAEKTVIVVDSHGRETNALTYCATAIDAGLRPFSWYLNHVLVGARETGVPADYLARIGATTCDEDPDSGRNARERAVHRRR